MKTANDMRELNKEVLQDLVKSKLRNKVKAKFSKTFYNTAFERSRMFIMH